MAEEEEKEPKLKRPRKRKYGKTCPQCGCESCASVGYTWWGGALGPALLKLHKCPECGASFNGKTGKPVTTAIWIYSIVAIIIVSLIGFALTNI